MQINNYTGYASITIYPFLQTRRVGEVVYAFTSNPVLPSPASNNQYTYSQISTLVSYIWRRFSRPHSKHRHRSLLVDLRSNRDRYDIFRRFHSGQHDSYFGEFFTWRELFGNCRGSGCVVFLPAVERYELYRPHARPNFSDAGRVRHDGCHRHYLFLITYFINSKWTA